MTPPVTLVRLPPCHCQQTRGVKHVHIERDRKPLIIPESAPGHTMAFLGAVPDWAAGGTVVPRDDA